MGKGQRSRLARADEVKEKKIAAKKKEKRDKIVRVISLITAIVLVIGLAGWIGYSVVDSNNRSSGSYLNKDIAVESANFKVTDAQLMYYFQNYYANMLSTYSAESLGLDTSKSLKEQQCAISADESGNTQTWYEYMMDGTVAQVKQTLVMAEAAKAAGVELDEHDTTEIENTLNNINPEDYAPGLTKEAIGEFMKMAMLASNYQTQVQESIECTTADMEKYYKENKNNYDKVDYRMYSFSYAAAEDEETTALTKEAAKKLADELAATGNETAYVDWLRNYFTTVVKPKDVEKELNNYKTEGAAYDESNAGNEFLFASSTKAGDIKVIDDETDECYKVYLMLAPAHRDETVTQSVRHILIGVDDKEDKEALATAKKEADDLLAKWKKDGGTEEAFAALVHDNTDDSGSAENGGLYENFPKGQMVAEFENWAYDAARKTGDTGIVQTDYGYHIMYYVGKGLPAWQATVKADIVSTEYAKQTEAFTEKHVVTVNDKNVKKIASYIA